MPLPTAWRLARQHGGDTVLHNLALSCPRCNLHKGPNLSSVDPQTGQVVRLFNPREDHWVDHFGRIGPTITGKSPTGRATVAALDMNNDDRIILRSLLIEEGVLPRTDP